MSSIIFWFFFSCIFLSFSLISKSNMSCAFFFLFLKLNLAILTFTRLLNKLFKPNDSSVKSPEYVPVFAISSTISFI